ncbi:unnamed protein product [Caenorhabditis bovis]|uniref:ZP domain-containing protein n=1 Tax=Caenorhabditis bovis TaxID=2654633 RepID=A0A8S1ECJ6_9PELO|nr:unnamed protein product [Caenorhabditis bovis]
MLFLVVLLPNLAVAASVIENSIIGDPEVICDVRQIKVRIKTANPFNGNLYSKGFFHKSDCRIRGDTTGSDLEIVMPVDSDCGIRRKRIMNPRGIVLDTTIVVMFHPVFLTQSDRSYRVQCQYSEADKSVTNVLDVSMQTPEDLPQAVQNEVLDGPVLSDNEHGQPLTYATVGDTVYHKWSCDGENKEMFCMTVHSCVVDDGQGFGQKLVDEKGCSLDTFILKELEYSENLVAGQTSNVFKFADKPTVFFSCMIRVEMKETEASKCFDPSMHCVNSMKPSYEENSVKTKSKFAKMIPPGFPRPQNITEKAGSDEFSEDIAAENDDNDFPDDNGPMDVLKISPSAMSRLIRRDLRTRYLADIDVIAPSVEVMDMAEDVLGNASPSPSASKKIQTVFKNQICISRIVMFLIIFITVILSSCALIMFYLPAPIFNGNAPVRQPTPRSIINICAERGEPSPSVAAAPGPCYLNQCSARLTISVDRRRRRIVLS